MSYIIGTATDVGDFLEHLDAFLRVGHSLDPVYSRDGDGVIDAILGTATSVQETIVVTFTDATHFSVAGSVSGALGSGTCGTPFSSSVVSFTITAGSTTPFANGDTISFVMTPPWTTVRAGFSQYLTGGAGTFTPNGGAGYLGVAFDGNQATWINNASHAFPTWFGGKLVCAKEIRGVGLQVYATAAEGATGFSLDYSDDGSSWTTAQTFSGISWSSPYQIQKFAISSAPGAHLYWRINVTGAGGNKWTDIANCWLYSETGCSQIVAGNDTIWTAPGNSGTSSSIVVGVSRFFDPTGDYDDLRLLGSIGWDPTLDNTSLPGTVTSSTPSPVIPLLRVGSIPYWITANGQRVAFTVKASTVYESAYLGFLNQYISPTLWPMPLVVAGSFAYSAAGEPGPTSTTWRWSYTGQEHTAYARGGWGSSTDAYFPLRLRLNSGVWRGFGVQGTAGTITPEYSIGTDLRPGADGSYPLFPLVLSDSAPAIYGELDGVAYVSGHANSSENRVVQKRIPWIVFQNIYRTNKYDYFAMKLA